MASKKKAVTIVVTGATGNVGRPLVDALAERGVRVRAITRNSRAASFPSGVEVIDGDPSNPDTLAAALGGAWGLFANPMAVQGSMAPLLALARERGLSRVVALSATNVDDDPATQPSRMRGVNHQEVERVLESCSLEWVAVRTGLHASNSIPLWSAQFRVGNVIRGTYAASTATPIHERDVAEVVVQALLTDDLIGTRPEITGPETLTQEEMVRAIGRAVGRSVRYEEILPSEAKRLMLERGFPFPAELIDRLHALLAKAVVDVAAATDGVPSILGRPATSFDSWARDHIGAFQLQGGAQ
ncbi:MAG: NAD(P)H-binding protein [Polyangiaceae bacterium]